jgi:heme exporter protein A
MHRRAGEALMQLIVEGLASTRGERSIFTGVSFTVDAGGALVLLGPNGSGKTTLIRIIAGLLPASAGTLRLTGADADRGVGEQCHYVGHLDAVKPSLTVDENARFWRGFLDGGEDAVEPALAAFGLDRLRDMPVAFLSAGQKRRLGLTRLLLAKRPLWLLDEPTVSLDGASREALLRVVAAHLDDGGLLIAATHVPLDLANASELQLGAAMAPA